MKNFYIFSTMSAAVCYTAWNKGASDLPIVHKKVTINGTAGIADKFLRTPRGAVTRVTEEELSILEADSVFQLHKANGFVTVEETNADIDAVVANMEGRDQSAPLVPGDFKDVTLDQSREGSNIGAPETTPGGKGGDRVKK